ncbi:MAG TPA: hypothetical protein PLI79_01495 [Mycobacterium sp.]|nr:hypothetical protein [Mycobacterium sp.]
MNQLPPPGWHPNPSGAGGYRYWDGHNWGQEAPPPAQVAPPHIPVAPQPKNTNAVGWIIGGLGALLVVAVVVVAVSGGHHKSNISSTTSSTSTPDVYVPDTHSQLIDLTMPSGSMVTRATTDTNDIEIWKVTADVRTAIEQVRRQLPVGKPLNGLPWCRDDWNRKLNLMQWQWTNGTEWINVSVNEDHKSESGSEVSIMHTRSDNEAC